jgi:hypothetical protein
MILSLKFKNRLAGLVFFALATMSFSSPAHAHDGPEATREETQEAYAALLGSLLQSTAPEAAPSAIPPRPLVYYGDVKLYPSGDAISRIVQSAEQHAVANAAPASGGCGRSCATCGRCAAKTAQGAAAQATAAASAESEHDHDHDHDEPGFFDRWRVNLNRFFLTMPSLFVRGFRQYGLSYAAYTLITETVEHIFIPHPAFCKLLQGAYFASAGLAANFCRVMTDPSLAQEEAAYRVKAAFHAAQKELQFRYFLKNRVHRGGDVPELTQLRQKNFHQYLELKGHEMGLLTEMLAGSLFWADLLPRYAGDGWRPYARPDASTPTTLKQQIEGRADADLETRLWQAYRISAYLELFTDMIVDVWDSQLTASYMEGQVSGHDYLYYLSINSVLGDLGKAIEVYKSQLLANATLENSEQKKLESAVLYDSLKAFLLPILQRSSILIETRQTDDAGNQKTQVKSLQDDIRKAIHSLKDYRRLTCNLALQ